jgi:nicotinate phosphoribosyltransferase
LIADLKRQGAKINAWGVGTKLITAHDNPSLNGVYKLVATLDNGAWRPKMKISSNVAKATDPGRKTVVRYFNARHEPLGDVLYGADEEWPRNGTISGRRRDQPHVTAGIRDAASAEPVLRTVFEAGRVVAPPVDVHAMRRRALDQIAAIPEEFKRLRNPEIYRVHLSPELGKLKAGLYSALGNA